MTQFPRGTVVHHKVMGKGIALNEVDEKGEKMIEVRMENGHIEKFFPEELETEQEVAERNRQKTERAKQALSEARSKMARRYGL